MIAVNKINWRVRVSNPHFWATLIPMLVLLAQAVAATFGMTIDLGSLQGKLLALVDAVFSLLAFLGFVNDPTTAGFADSARAMTYEKPKEG